MASSLAALSRNAPFERGRWRIGSLAQSCLNPAATRDLRRTVATRHGFRMNLSLGEFVDRTIYCTGEWEPLESGLIRQILRPGDTFADVGANIGYFTLLGAELVGASGKVHAFEANRKTFALLQDNLALNACDTVKPWFVAVGDAPGSAWIAHEESGNAGADFAIFDAADAAGRGEAVPVQRLDTMLDDPALRLIKIDIEGAEAKAIRGADALLQRAAAPDLIFEFTPAFLRRCGDDPAELLEFIRSRGYRLHEIGKAGLAALPSDVAERRQTYLYCTKG